MASGLIIDQTLCFFYFERAENIAFNKTERRIFKLMARLDNARGNWEGSLIKTNKRH